MARRTARAALAVALLGMLPGAFAGAADVPEREAVQLAQGLPAAATDNPLPLGPLLARGREAVARGKAADAYPMLEAQSRWYAGSVEFDYLLGVAALDAGRPGEAILALERVLGSEPGHLQARAEIARAYLAARETESARREFEAVASQPIPADVRRVIDGYLAGIASQLAAGQAQTSGYLEFAMGWDSNVNLGSASSQWLLAGGLSVTPERISRPSSSAQSTVNGGFSWLVPMSGGWQWIGGAQVSHRANPSAHTLDSTSLDLNTGFGWRNGCHSANMLAQYQHLRLAQASFRDAAGVLLQWRCDISPKAQWGLYGQATDIRFDEQPVRNARRFQAGVTTAAMLPVPADTILVGSAYAGQETPRAELDQLHYRFAGVRSALNFASRQGWRWSAALAIEERRYAGPEPLFDQTRRDRQLEASLSTERKIDRDWFVQPQVSVMRNRSNLAPNDFRRTQVQVAVRRRF